MARGRWFAIGRRVTRLVGTNCLILRQIGNPRDERKGGGTGTHDAPLGACLVPQWRVSWGSAALRAAAHVGVCSWSDCGTFVRAHGKGAWYLLFNLLKAVSCEETLTRCMNLRGLVYTMDHKVVPRLCKICDWL